MYKVVDPLPLLLLGAVVQDVGSVRCMVVMFMQPCSNFLHDGCESLLRAVLRRVGDRGSNLCFCGVEDLLCHG